MAAKITTCFLLLASLVPWQRSLACDECGTHTGDDKRVRLMLQPIGGFARQLSMGGSEQDMQVIRNPFITRDISQLYENPAYLHDYKNSLLANIGGGDLSGISSGNNGFGHQNAALSIRVNDTWAAGALLGHNPTSINYINKLAFDGGGYFPGIIRRSSTPTPDIENAYTGMVSYKMDSTWKVGVALTYVWNKWDTAATITTPASNFEEYLNSKAFQVRLGGVYNFADKSLMDFHFAYTSDKANDVRTVNGVSDGTYSTKGTELRFGGRYIHRCSERMNFSGVADYCRVTATPREDNAPIGLTAATRTQDFSYSGLTLGLGGEYSARRFLIAGGLSYKYEQITAEQTDPAGTTSIKSTMTGIPVLNIGAEYRPTRHWAVRVGHYRTAQDVETVTTTPGGSSTSSHTRPNSTINFGGFTPFNNDAFYTLGLGFRTGGFAIDATVSEEALRRGLVFGSNDNLNAFGYMSASFQW